MSNLRARRLFAYVTDHCTLPWRVDGRQVLDLEIFELYHSSTVKGEATLTQSAAGKWKGTAKNQPVKTLKFFKSKFICLKMVKISFSNKEKWTN